LHLPLALEAPREENRAYDEPYVFGQPRPTVDKPGPFTLREYVRLSLLRARIQEGGSRTADEAPMIGTKGTRL
jgi:hypothetical protein